MSITCFSLIFNVVCILLLSSQASSTRLLTGTVPISKDHTIEKKRLLLDHSLKNDDATKAKTAINIPSKENAKLLSEQQRESISFSATKRDQEASVEGESKDQEHASKANKPFLDPHNKDLVKDQSKIVKSRVNMRGARIPMTVTWSLPEQKRTRRKKKKRGYSYDPDLSSDYAPPRVHPPCHN